MLYVFELEIVLKVINISINIFRAGLQAVVSSGATNEIRGAQTTHSTTLAGSV